jgi:hypothetical protein
MKGLIAGSIFVLVLGTLGFLYRNAVEQSLSQHQMAASLPVGGKACEADAKICPDGSAVSRGGPDCSFAVCPLPNIEIDLASTTISFVLPSGYTKASVAQSDPTLLGTYTQTNTDQNDASSISLHEYAIPAGEQGSQVMLAQTIFNSSFNSSGLAATSTGEFSSEQIGGNTFSTIVIGRTSEGNGEVESAYYIQNGADLLRFDCIERGVQDATDPGLDVKTLPQHEAFTQMLATLQLGT